MSSPSVTKELQLCGRDIQLGDEVRVCYGIDHYRRAIVQVIDRHSQMVGVRLGNGQYDRVRFNQIC